MADENLKKENGVTPQGPVEIDESDLDQAAGGLSVNTSNIEMTYKPKPKAPADPDSCLNNKYPENM